MKKYDQYFDIDKSYHPEINPNSIKDEELKWQDTFPHESFVKLLRNLERVLSRETTQYQHGIMVDGTYGIGKSRLLWTIENLLKCSEEEFLSYFDEYPELEKEPDLRDRLLSHKKENILVITKYGDSGSDIKEFIVKVYDSITKELDAHNMNFAGGNSLRGKISDWLSDEANSVYFENLLKKPEYRGYGNLAGKSIDEIISQLNNTKEEADGMVSDILSIAKERGILAFNIEMDDLKDWITEIIHINNLDAVLFIWDEFSTFFETNKNQLNTFQKLVELSESEPFYLMVAVHSADALKNQGGSMSSVYDRFIHCTVEMPDNVAFSMIRHAIKKNPINKDEYKELTEEINSYVYDARTKVADQIGIKEDILRDILPIHPIAALILKYIATEFASNQRSMFNFIKNDDSDNLKAFQWYIKNFSPENNDILTADYLWNFFYESGTDENTDGRGRSLLRESVVAILDSYSLNESKLNSTKEKRVLKVVLMMQALSIHGPALLHPTDANITLAFNGDDNFTSGEVMNIVRNRLVKNHILFFDDVNKEYAVYAMTGDHAQIQKIRDKYLTETKTAQLIGNSEDFINSIFNFKPHIKKRFTFHAATVDDFKITCNKAVNKATDSYQIQVIVCIARNEDEQSKIQEMIKSRCIEDRNLVFIDASSNLMGLERFNNWVSLTADYEYWRNKQPSIASNKQNEANNKIIEWKNLISGGKFTILSSNDFEEPCSNSSNVADILLRYVLKIYPLTFDNAKISDTCFNAAIKYATTAGLTQGEGISGDKKGMGAFSTNMASLLGEVRNVEKYWEVYPDNPFSRLKVKVDEFVLEKLTSESRVFVNDIANFLIEDYGFIPGALYTCIMSFLLKEYATDTYRYSIGDNGDMGGIMNPIKFIELMCTSSMSTEKTKKRNYIEIMTQNQKAFVDFVVDVFEISNESSVEIAASKLRKKIEDLKYPIWCFECIDENNLNFFIDKIAKICHNSDGNNVPTLAEEFGKKLLEIPTATNHLKKLLTTEKGASALMEYLENFEKGEIITISKKIGINNLINDVQNQISRGSAAWLWDEKDGQEQLKILLCNYRIIDISNQITGKTTKTFFDCIRDFREYICQIKMPSSIIIKYNKSLRVLMNYFVNITKNLELTYEKREKFYNELIDNLSLVSSIKDITKDILNKEFLEYVEGFNNDEIKSLIASLPNDSFISDTSTYETNLKNISENMRKKQKYFQLKSMWQELTNSESPYKWSENNQTPIIILVPDNEQNRARELFNILNNGNSGNNTHFKVESALEFLSSTPEFITKINDLALIDATFRTKLLKKYDAILHDISEVRKRLIKTGISPFDWYDNHQISNEIEKFASSVYKTGGNKKVMEKIDNMNADKVKELLKNLVREDVDVGISIIKKEGEQN